MAHGFGWTPTSPCADHPAIIGAAGAILARRSRFNEVASVFVCCDHVASVIVNRESAHHVNGCCASRIRLHYRAWNTFDGNISRLVRVEHDLPFDGNGGKPFRVVTVETSLLDETSLH